MASLVEIRPRELRQLTHLYLPEQPGPIIAPHVANTGVGRAWVDHPSDPQVLIAQTGANFALHGDPRALTPAAIRPLLQGFVAPPNAFVPLLETTFPQLVRWPRRIGVRTQPPEPPAVEVDSAEVRPFQDEDGPVLAQFDPNSRWIADTWGGPAQLAASGYGYGAWIKGSLVSIAVTFFLGNMYEDIGVVTHPDYRGMGLSTACVHALCHVIFARGHLPTWATSADNAASWRVAEKLGFTHVRDDLLYVIGIDLPTA